MEVNHLERSDVPQFTVRIPIDVDLNLLHNPFKLNKKKGDDTNAYILGMLAYKSKQKKIKYDSYHQLSGKVLNSLFRNEYPKHLKSLIENGYIKQYSNPYSYTIKGVEYKSNGTFSIGQSSKRYALNYKKPLFKDYIITDKILIAKIKKARIERTQRTIANIPTAKKIYDSIKLLSIDEAGAIAFLNKKYNKSTIDAYIQHLHKSIGIEKTSFFLQEINQTKVDRDLQRIFKKYGFPITHRKEAKKILKSNNSLQYRLHQVEIIKRIQNGEHDLISIIADNKTGRLFHTLTMTPKNLKPFLMLDNEPLIELDASNCQWWLMQKVLNILVSKGFLGFFNNKESNILPFNLHKYILPYTQTHHTTYMFNTFLNKNKEVIQKESAKLGALLYNGTFRTTFINEFAKQGKTIDDGDIKKWLIKHILFSNPSEPYHKNLKIVNEFTSLFPYLTKIIKDLKLYMLNEKELQPKQAKRNKNKDVRWKCLAILLQKMEADIFVKDMATTDGIFITLHDALITNDSNLHKINLALTQSIEKRNLKMTLKLSRI
jgi:hypothetical protein